MLWNAVARTAQVRLQQYVSAGERKMPMFAWLGWVPCCCGVARPSSACANHHLGKDAPQWPSKDTLLGQQDHQTQGHVWKPGRFREARRAVGYGRFRKRAPWDPWHDIPGLLGCMSCRLMYLFLSGLPDGRGPAMEISVSMASCTSSTATASAAPAQAAKKRAERARAKKLIFMVLFVLCNY